MKKIIPLLFCTVVLTSAFAQSNSHDRNDGYNRGYNNNTVYQNNSNWRSQRDLQIQKVSAQYDYRINQVSYDRSLSRREKKFTIRTLRVQKAEQINRIIAQSNNNNASNNKWDRGDRHNHDNDRYNR